jgi:hypothetical protein
MNVAKYAKFVVALGGVVAVVVAVAFDGHLSPEDIGAIVVAAAAALGVRQVPNAA